VGRFEFISTSLPGLSVVRRGRIEDARGFLSRLYCAHEFAAAGLAKPLSQINVTMTRKKGTVRGMHFQRPPHAEAKIVSCLHGEVFDVAIDLRRRSSTFLRWHAEILSSANERALLIPEGFAHGFQALTDDCELLYLHTAVFEPSAEGGLNAVDPRLGIAWPLNITEMSDRDRCHPMVPAEFEGLQV
jgi:dTDP-4-dehydrorhamnose 3,5-epimerase